MKADTSLLTSALQAEITHTIQNEDHACPLVSAEVEAVPSLPEGWVRLQLVLADYSTLKIFGEAGEILSTLIKRRGGLTSPLSNVAEYWPSLGGDAPPRLEHWPEARRFWASPHDENQGCFAVYSVPQNCGIRYVAGYEGPHAKADDNANYANLCDTPAGAADLGFPTHWHNNSREPWELFLASLKGGQPPGE